MLDRNHYSYVKGVNKSDRLGDVLSVDFSPTKVCSFDCIYCGVGRTTDKTLQRRAFYPVEDVLNEIQDWVAKNGLPDYALLTGSGEPMLYSELGRLVRLIKAGIPEMKLTLYSNGSLLHVQEVRREVSAFDLVVVNLNAVDDNIFQQICRPHEDVKIDELIDGIKLFRKEYVGPLWLDVVLIKGLNTREEVLERLLNTIGDIAPDRFIIRPPRPAAGDSTKPVRIEIPERLKEKCRNLPFDVDYAV